MRPVLLLVLASFPLVACAASPPPTCNCNCAPSVAAAPIASPSPPRTVDDDAAAAPTIILTPAPTTPSSSSNASPSSSPKGNVTVAAVDPWDTKQNGPSKPPAPPVAKTSPSTPPTSKPCKQDGPFPTPFDPCEEPTAPPTSPSPNKPCAPFDVDLATAHLAAVGYKDCPGAGKGFVDVTFSSSGVATATSVEGALAGNDCIAGRFAKARVSPFCKGEVTIRWPISL